MSPAWLLRLYYLTSYASMGVFLPFISPWLVAFGISGFQLSLVSATRPLAGVLAPFFFGWVADRFRLRGSLMQWACMASVIPFSIISLLLCMGQRVGVLSAFLTVAAFSFLRIPMLTIADVTALERTQHFGSLRLWGSMGFLLATLGFGSVEQFSGSVAFPLAISLSLLAAVGAARKLPQRAEPPCTSSALGISEYLTRRDHVLMVFVWILWSASHVAYDMCISLYVHDLGGRPKDVSLAWGIGTLAEVVMMGFCGVVLPRASHVTWTFIGLLITTLRWAVISQVRSLPVLLLLQPLHAISFALLWMTWLDYVRQSAPLHLLGRAQGILSTAVSIGGVAGMFVWGPLYAHIGPKSVFIGAACVAAAAALIALVPLLGSNVQWQRSRLPS